MCVMSENRLRRMPSQRCHRHGMSSAPSGQCAAIACSSTSLGTRKAFPQPCHSHTKGVWMEMRKVNNRYHTHLDTGQQVV